MSNSEEPEATTGRVTRSSRNPKRRTRQSDNDTLKTAAPRRKRSKITDETYAARDSTEHGSVAPEQEHVEAVVEVEVPLSSMNGHATSHAHSDSHYSNGLSLGRHARHDSTPAVDVETHMAMRGGRRGGTVTRAHHRGDGATTLCQNQCYSVKMLPATPKELRKEGAEYRGSIHDHHALAVTPDRALIWDFTAHIAGANPRVFDVPFPSRAGEPLPFGALVPSGGIGAVELGLVLVSATMGKVVFYESISRAASLGLFHDRKSAVDGAIALSSGETVTDIVSADHAGFAVILSSGKLVHLTLRDAQGKPKVSAQQLKINEPGAGGVFGSFTGLLKSTYRRDLSAVHTRPLNLRGRMQVIGLTERAEVLLWDLDWSGRNEFRASIDFREALTKELRETGSPEMTGHAEYPVALDFVIADKPGDPAAMALAATNAEQPLFLYILLRVGTSDMYRYTLVEISLPGDGDVSIDRVHQLSTYTNNSPLSTRSKPRLVLPKPGHTVFVAFEDATVLAASQESIPESPEAQLHASYIQPDSFEETIYLQPKKSLAIQSTCAEQSKGSLASAVAFVKSAGLVRITAADVNKLPGGPKISAKTKIEQAVFHGILQQDNIVDFSRNRSDSSHYDLEEIEDAALRVSDEILRAETAFTHFVSPSPTSMEQHLASKAVALKALIDHVRQSYPAVSQSTLWRLLWDAERVAAGQRLWITFEEHVALTSKEKRKATILDELCAWFTEQGEQFAQRKDLQSENDVRKFFIGGLHHLERLLQWVRQLLKSEKDDASSEPKRALTLVAQANDVCARSLQAAYDFRTEHCGEYGIEPALIEDGILIAPEEYTGLPEFWTSAMKLVENTVVVANLCSDIAKNNYESALDEECNAMVQNIAIESPSFIQLWCTQSLESIKWRSAQEDPKLRELADKLLSEFEDERYKQLRRLADMGQADAGMRLAEKYHDMNTLTDMVIAEDQYMEEQYHIRDMNRSAVLAARNDLKKRIRQYFDQYKEEWSNAFFDKLFSTSSSGAQLLRAQIEWKEPLTKYLRANTSRAKLCWINDVTETSDYAHAATALKNAAEGYETRLWSKKVELSMSKLALMAAQEEGEPELRIADAAMPTSDLTIVKIQEQLYQHLLPTIVGSIDREAESKLCMDKYGGHVADLTALRHLLESALDMVLDGTALTVEQLLDVLTLMDIDVAKEEDSNFQGSELFKALVVLDAAAPSMPVARFENLLQLVWKRVYIHDDWNTIKVMSKKADADRSAAILSTTAWLTIYHLLDSGMLRNPDTSIRLLLPSDTIGAGCKEEDFAHRFPDQDLLDPIIHNARVQDEMLQSFIEDRGLEQIVEQCIRDAEALIREQDADRAAMDAHEKRVQEGYDQVPEVNGYADGYQEDGYDQADGLEVADEFQATNGHVITSSEDKEFVEDGLDGEFGDEADEEQEDFEAGEEETSPEDDMDLGD